MAQTRNKTNILLSSAQVNDFQKVIWNYSKIGYRDMPWRHSDQNGWFDPYKILISEIMLQQTQVSRVVPKFQEFISKFPDFQTLASASLGDVLTIWSGLGYNRRAKHLWQSAQIVQQRGKFPLTVQELVELPGVGVNTASAILVYCFNKPLVFIETNIRTVFLYHFFPHSELVSDKQLLPLIEQTMDVKRAREWYWGLMD